MVPATVRFDVALRVIEFTNVIAAPAVPVAAFHHTCCPEAFWSYLVAKLEVTYVHAPAPES